MDERTRRALRLLDEAAREMRRQHDLQTALIDNLCSLADELCAMADEPTLRSVS